MLQPFSLGMSPNPHSLALLPIALRLFALMKESDKWHSHRSIRRVSITFWRLLTTKPLRIIISRPLIFTISANTKRRRSTQLRLTNIASSPTNIRRLPTVILRRRPNADYHGLRDDQRRSRQIRDLKHDQLAIKRLKELKLEYVR